MKTGDGDKKRKASAMKSTTSSTQTSTQQPKSKKKRKKTNEDLEEELQKKREVMTDSEMTVNREKKGSKSKRTSTATSERKSTW